MRRFELVEGSSSKFWEVAVEGADVTVRFGRIGTAGQTKTKAFADADAARKEHDKLVKEKAGKGYAETGVAAGATLVAVPAAAAVATPPPSLPAPAPAPPVEPTAVPPPIAAASTPTSIDWPQGGFEWTDSLRAGVPVLRGVHVPPPDRTDPLAALPIVLEDDRHGYYAKVLADLAARAQRSWVPWGEQRSAELTTREHLAQPDPAFWLELFAQALVLPHKTADKLMHYYTRTGLTMALRAGITLHGLPWVIDRAFDLCELEKTTGHLGQIKLNLLDPLRLAIAQADETHHDAAMAAADRLRLRSEAARVVAAYLFPHLQDWAEACVADRLTDGHALLAECALTAPTGLVVLRNLPPYLSMLRGAVLLQLKLHDEAAFDVLAHLLAKANDRDGNEKVIALLVRMRSPRTIRTLAQWCERKEVRQALDDLSERWPAAVLLSVVEQAFASRSRLIEGWAVRMALRRPEALAQVLPALGESERARLQQLLASLAVEEAPAETLPALLREPPWLRKARATELPTLAIAAAEVIERIDTAPEVKAREAALPTKLVRQRLAPRGEPPQHLLDKLRITPDGQARVLAGQLLLESDIVSGSRSYGMPVELLLLLPDAAALAVWNSYPPADWSSYSELSAPVRALLARHGVPAITGLVRLAGNNPLDALAIAHDVDSPRLVPAALHALRSLKKARSVAIDWLRAHADTAIAAALPMAFGSERAARDDAQFGLRWFIANGFENHAREIAAHLAPELPAALQALRDADPLLVLPARLPKLPAFFVPASFRRPALKGGGVIGAEAAGHVGSMLAISKIEAPYAGIAVLRETCTPESLAEFAWDLFEAWIAAGAPSKEGWAFAALGLLGNDETARRLAPRIREWPGEAAHLRAVMGLDLLAAIGSDVALMHLNGIASKVKFKALQDRAREKIAAVAEARGLTAAELADRLVPDLGLDESGTLMLDFGPRRFFVAFDETLKPFVKDAQGVRLKDLPKPLRSDDAALAEAATERWKQIRKDAKAVASLQVTRLELGMIDRRRWTFTDFRLFFLEHPLMRHLATRLVWGVYEAGTLVRALRVAEDFTLADEHDELATLAGDALLGIAHVLEMPEPLRAAFGQLFADYEILQPFRQLGRETYALTPEELRGSRIERFKAKTVATGSVLGLVNRGWERGQAQDAGFVGWFSKDVGNGWEVHLEIEPGTIVGDPSYEPKQTLPAIELRRRGTWNPDGLVTYDQLHPILASEVLRDVDLLAPLKE